VPCRNRCGVFAGENAADGLQVGGTAGGDSEGRGKLGFGRAGSGHGFGQLGGKLVGRLPGPGLQRAGLPDTPGSASLAQPLCAAGM
jgi:hypothetical protein